MPENVKYLSKFTLKDGTVVEIKDRYARDMITNGVKFIGVTTTAITDRSETNPVVIGGEDYLAENGNIAIYGAKEFIFVESDSRWHEFGDASPGGQGFGALAFKDSAEGSFTPSGTVSKPSIDVTPSMTNVNEVLTQGSVTEGSAAECTLPQLQMAYDANASDFSISWTPGSFQTNTPTQVTLPTSRNIAVVTGVSAELHDAPEFTGTEGTVEVE